MENREIKFRAKVLGENNWTYSNGFMKHKDGLIIIITKELDEHVETSPIQENTLCQFTGLKDKNGQDIYEADVLNSNYFKNAQVVFWRSGWHLRTEKDTHYSFDTSMHSFEIIGNIHENSNLL